ncbi:hypothetical protein HDU76_003602 [Blyttiomyces sp. JEL0837]|nr:hypothetical protein HDU76_003602 [Blyttiomyces sp. JEL0837]
MYSHRTRGGGYWPHRQQQQQQQQPRYQGPSQGDAPRSSSSTPPTPGAQPAGGPTGGYLREDPQVASRSGRRYNPNKQRDQVPANPPLPVRAPQQGQPVQKAAPTTNVRKPRPYNQTVPAQAGVSTPLQRPLSQPRNEWGSGKNSTVTPTATVNRTVSFATVTPNPSVESPSSPERNPRGLTASSSGPGRQSNQTSSMNRNPITNHEIQPHGATVANSTAPLQGHPGASHSQQRQGYRGGYRNNNTHAVTNDREKYPPKNNGHNPICTPAVPVNRKYPSSIGSLPQSPPQNLSNGASPGRQGHGSSDTGFVLSRQSSGSSTIAGSNLPSTTAHTLGPAAQQNRSNLPEKKGVELKEAEQCTVEAVKKLEAVTKERNEYQAEATKFKLQLREMKDLVDQERADNVSKLKTAKGTVCALEKELESKQKQLDCAKVTESDMRQRLLKAEETAQNFKARVDEQEDSINQQSKAHRLESQESQKQLEQSEMAHSEALEDIAKLTTALNSAQKDLSEAKAKETQLVEKLKLMETKLEDLRAPFDQQQELLQEQKVASDTIKLQFDHERQEFAANLEQAELSRSEAVIKAQKLETDLATAHKDLVSAKAAENELGQDVKALQDLNQELNSKVANYNSLPGELRKEKEAKADADKTIESLMAQLQLERENTAKAKASELELSQQVKCLHSALQASTKEKETQVLSEKQNVVEERERSREISEERAGCSVETGKAVEGTKEDGHAKLGAPDDQNSQKATVGRLEIAKGSTFDEKDSILKGLEALSKSGCEGSKKNSKGAGVGEVREVDAGDKQNLRGSNADALARKKPVVEPQRVYYMANKVPGLRYPAHITPPTYEEGKIIKYTPEFELALQVPCMHMDLPQGLEVVLHENGLKSNSKKSQLTSQRNSTSNRSSGYRPQSRMGHFKLDQPTRPPSGTSTDRRSANSPQKATPSPVIAKNMVGATENGNANAVKAVAVATKETASNLPEIATTEVLKLVPSATAWRPSRRTARSESSTSQEDPSLKAQSEEDAALQSMEKEANGYYNKLTVEKFDTISGNFLKLELRSETFVLKLAYLIVDKSVMQPHFHAMYANLCSKLHKELPRIFSWMEVNQKQGCFRKHLLDRCQDIFSNREDWSKDEYSGHNLSSQERIAILHALSPEDKEKYAMEQYKRDQAKRKYLGNVEFMAQLFKVEILPGKVIERVVSGLSTPRPVADVVEEEVETLVKLLSTAGPVLDTTPSGRTCLDKGFERIEALAGEKSIDSRVRFAIKDVMDLRKNGWKARVETVGPTTRAEIRRMEEEKERQKLAAAAQPAWRR